MVIEMKNILKEKLRNGESALGSWISIAHQEIPEILSLLDFDWFLFDMEHGPLTVASLQSLLQTTDQKITPLVRVPNNELVYIKQALDVGGQGIMVPMVNNMDQAEFAVRCAKYPPAGIRGTGARRASSFYTKHSEYLDTANQETMVVVQIETEEAIRNFEEIVATKDVDAWFVGPIDLAASLGHLGDPDSEDVQEAMDSILKIANRNDVPGGTLAFSVNSAKSYLDKGFRLLAIGSDDSFLLAGATSVLNELKHSR